MVDSSSLTVISSGRSELEEAVVIYALVLSALVGLGSKSSC